MPFENKFAALQIVSDKDKGNVRSEISTNKPSVYSVLTDSNPGSPIPSLVTIEDEEKNKGKTWAQVASTGVRTKKVVFKKNKSPTIKNWIYQTSTKKRVNTVPETPTKPVKHRKLNQETQNAPKWGNGSPLTQEEW